MCIQLPLTNLELANVQAVNRSRTILSRPRLLSRLLVACLSILLQYLSNADGKAPAMPPSDVSEETNSVAIMARAELNLIVAATRSMGIGRAGDLPWIGLKKEMAYFARVTKRAKSAEGASSRNAVIMGRKTWDSIPPKFRPLKGRLNVVLTRARTNPSPSRTSAPDDGPIEFSSITSALAVLEQDTSIDRVFVIGGAEIYKAALELTRPKRILLTRVLSDFDCDTFLPLDLERGDWKMRTLQELNDWTGESISASRQEENGVKYEHEMYESIS